MNSCIRIRPFVSIAGQEQLKNLLSLLRNAKCSYPKEFKSSKKRIEQIISKVTSETLYEDFEKEISEALGNKNISNKKEIINKNFAFSCINRYCNAKVEIIFQMLRKSILLNGVSSKKIIFEFDREFIDSIYGIDQSQSTQERSISEDIRDFLLYNGLTNDFSGCVYRIPKKNYIKIIITLP